MWKHTYHVGKRLTGAKRTDPLDAVDLLHKDQARFETAAARRTSLLLSRTVNLDAFKAAIQLHCPEDLLGQIASWPCAIPAAPVSASCKGGWHWFKLQSACFSRCSSLSPKVHQGICKEWRGVWCRSGQSWTGKSQKNADVFCQIIDSWRFQPMQVLTKCKMDRT